MPIPSAALDMDMGLGDCNSNTFGTTVGSEAVMEAFYRMVHNPPYLPIQAQAPALAPPSPFGTASSNSNTSTGSTGTSTGTGGTDLASPFGTPALDHCATAAAVHSPFVSPLGRPSQAQTTSTLTLTSTSTPSTTVTPSTSTTSSTHHQPHKTNTPTLSPHPAVGAIPFSPGNSSSSHTPAGTNSSNTTASTTVAGAVAVPVAGLGLPAPVSRSRPHPSALPLHPSTAPVGGLAARRSAASHLSLNLANGTGVGRTGIGGGVVGMMSAPLRPRSAVVFGMDPAEAGSGGQQHQHQQQAMSISPHLLHPHGYQQASAGGREELLLERHLEPASYFPILLPSARGPLQRGMDMEGGERHEAPVAGQGAEPGTAGWDGKAEEVAAQVGWAAFQGMDMDMVDMAGGMRRGAGAEWDSMFQDHPQVLHRKEEAAAVGLQDPARDFVSSSQSHREWDAAGMGLELLQMEMFAEQAAVAAAGQQQQQQEGRTTRDLLSEAQTTLPFRSTLQSPSSAPPGQATHTHIHSPSQAPGSGSGLLSRASAPLPTPTSMLMGAPSDPRRQGQAAGAPGQAQAQAQGAVHNLVGSPSWRSAMATRSPHLPRPTDGAAGQAASVASGGSSGFFPFQDPLQQTREPSRLASRPSSSLQPIQTRTTTMGAEGVHLQARAHSHSLPATPASEANANANGNRNGTDRAPQTSHSLPPALSLHDLQTQYMHMLPHLATLHGQQLQQQQLQQQHQQHPPPLTQLSTTPEFFPPDVPTSLHPPEV